MKKIATTILTLCSVMQLLAQGDLTISGKVTELKTGTPLSFATVGVKGSPHGTVSNADGEFTFFLPDSYLNDTLFISYVGFETYQICIKAAVLQPQDVALKESIIMLEEVQVAGEELTGVQIMQRALDRLNDNYSRDSFIINGIFRDIRDQNEKTVYLTEAAISFQDPGYSTKGDRPKKFYIKGMRASDTRINSLLWGSLLNHGNALTVNMENNFWLNRLKHSIKKHEFEIEDVFAKGDRILYSILTSKSSAISPLADHHQDMTFELSHRYLVDSETYAIYKVEHFEKAHKGKYIGVEPPYEGDSLFYSKKGWHLVIEFEEYDGRMYLKYQDANYAFDIVDEKNEQIYLDMNYQFTFVTTEIITDPKAVPEGIKMNRSKPLAIQDQSYDHEFWSNPNNAKLVPLTSKQLSDLAEERPLEEQFRSKKKRLRRDTK